MSSLLTLAADKKKFFIDLTNPYRMIKVCNLPPAASKMQILTLFAFFGDIESCVIYPTDDDLIVLNKVAFIKYLSAESASGAIHLTNTQYLDKVMIVTPLPDEIIPNEETLFYESKRWSASAQLEQINIQGANPVANVQFYFGFSHVPPVPKYDEDMAPLKASELQRTVYIHNVHPQIKADSLLTLFSGIGEVKYVKVGSAPNSDRNYGLVEFTDAGSIPYALQYNDFPLNGYNIKVDYSLISIDKRAYYSRNRRSNSREDAGSRKPPSPEWKRTQPKEPEPEKRKSPPKRKKSKDRSSPDRHKSKRDHRSRSRDRRSSRRKSPDRRHSMSSKNKDKKEHKRSSTES